MGARETIEAIERSNTRKRNPALAAWEDALDARLADAYDFPNDAAAATYVNAHEDAEPDTGRVEARQPAVIGAGEGDGALDRAAAGGMQTGIGRYHGHVLRDRDAYALEDPHR